MKKFLAALILMLAAGVAHGQASVGANLQYSWLTTATTVAGQLGQYVFLNGTTAPRPSQYSVDWNVTGTAPTACTYNLQGSSDQVNWYNLDGAQAIPCTVSGNNFVLSKPVLAIRIQLVTFTRGDATTVVKFFYNGGRG